jgi:hypothetical protein
MHFPVGFRQLYRLGFDLLTGVFTLVPLALIDRRPNVTVRSMAAQLGPGFRRRLRRRVRGGPPDGDHLHLRLLPAPGRGRPSDRQGRTVGYAEFAATGMFSLFVRVILCNWIVSTMVVAAGMSTSVSGKVLAMWMPIMLFFDRST